MDDERILNFIHEILDKLICQEYGVEIIPQEEWEREHEK